MGVELHLHLPEIRRRLAAGETQATVAEAIGISIGSVNTIAKAHSVNRRSWPRLSSDQRAAAERLLKRDRLSIRETARTVGCSVRTAWVIRQSLGLQRSTRRTKPKRCHGCGHTVTVDPCLICSARARFYAA